MLVSLRRASLDVPRTMRKGAAPARTGVSLKLLRWGMVSRLAMSGNRWDDHRIG
jgi:hypothetical protein